MTLRMPWRARRRRAAAPDCSVRFARAVPRWRDRLELRRRLRSVAREVAAEQKRDVTLSLRRLAARRVPLVAVWPAVSGGELLEFKDGTRLQLDVREGEVAFERLANRQMGSACLSGVIPILGHCWYLLQFSAPWSRVVEVLARVDRYEFGGSRFTRGTRRRGHRAARQIGQAQP